MMIVKPKMIQDDFMGDFYLGCPNCKEAVHFPMVRHPELHKPKNCSKCNAEFDWKEDDEMMILEAYKIADHFGLTGQENQLIEEMAELTQAICKWNRQCGCGQSLPKGTTVLELEEHIFEELADVKLVLEQVIYLLDCGDAVQEIMKQKIKRTLERIGEK